MVFKITMQNALVLVFDRLGSGYLGPYGNTWIETPAWNRLAARSMLMEYALTDSPDLDTAYYSLWQGRHACGCEQPSDTPALATLLDSHAVESWLVTDDPDVAAHPLAGGFVERVILPVPNGEEPATGAEETHLAQILATTLDVLERAQPPFLIWVHAQAMQGPWDAPYEMRCQFADEEDPVPPSFVLPPQQRLEPDFDPDEVLGVAHGYAGQIALLDFCLGFLLDAFWAGPHAASTALLATSPRGYPLGEHLRVGPCDEALYTELIGIPWFIHLPNDDTWSSRDHRIVQPPDIYATLLDLLGHELPSPTPWGRSLFASNADKASPRFDCATSCHGSQRAVRTPAWFLRQSGGDHMDLFVKPDDRWEVNEVSNRCHDAVEALAEVLAQFQTAAQAGNRDQLPPLPPILQ